MNIAYFGTPEISAELLKEIIESSLSIKLVITQPDKPVGKRLASTSTPVKLCAEKYSIPVIDTELRGDSMNALIKQLNEHTIDLCLLFAYGKLISKTLLQSPKYGFWNVHPSLLPAYRGAAPTIYPLLLGENATGVTLMQMNENLDEGDVLLQDTIEILPHERRPELEEKLVRCAARQIIQAVSTDRALLPQTPQSSTGTSYTRRISKRDGFVELDFLKIGVAGTQLGTGSIPPVFSSFYAQNHAGADQDMSPAQMIYNMFRAFDPWPGVWTEIVIGKSSKRLKLSDMSLKDGHIDISRVQLEGKSVVPFKTFVEAYSF